ncbi:MAG: hypothetical protein QOI06_60 [Nocardioidaceae bacterium]|jgi:hypothetical protein|nr:hypothetical protein [Nocardioidaceae bacterium]
MTDQWFDDQGIVERLTALEHALVRYQGAWGDSMFSPGPTSLPTASEQAALRRELVAADASYELARVRHEQSNPH